MGLFDTVTFKCVVCASMVEAQTKAGDCTLALYDLGRDDVPVEIIRSMDGESTHCECGQRYGFRAVQRPVLCVDIE